MSERLLRLTNRIQGELDDLGQVIEHVQEGLHRAEWSGDDPYLDGVALNLQCHDTTRRRTYGGFKRENCGETGILT